MLSFNINKNFIVNPYQSVPIEQKKVDTTNGIPDDNITNIRSNIESKAIKNNYQASCYGKNYNINFCASLRTEEEKKKFNDITSKCDRETIKNLNFLLKTGVLQNNNSNDKTSVLDNLHKMATTERIEGIDNKKVLKETIEALANPFSITQKFGDIPSHIKNIIIENPKGFQTPVLSNNAVSNVFTNKTLSNQSSCCVAASMEFNLAHKMPAEFTRMAEELSSQKMQVTKKIKLNSISESKAEALTFLNEFKIPYKIDDWDRATVILKPDRNAIIKARIQSSYRNKNERSIIDVLMQSTFMNIGSQQTYNTLTDTSDSAFNLDKRGLTETEKNFTEAIVEDKNKVSLIYQVLDENARLVDRICDLKTIEKHIVDSVNSGHNVIVGITSFDNSNQVINGHEITVIGVKKGLLGENIFICNDTDDNINSAIKIKASELIPSIHHAGIPKEVLKDSIEFIPAWEDTLDYVNTLKTSIDSM